MKIYKEEEPVDPPIVNGATIKISQWGQERIFVYQEGLKHSLPLILKDICKELEPMRDPDEIFKL